MARFVRLIEQQSPIWLQLDKPEANKYPTVINTVNLFPVSGVDG